jgi:hypothetical protein
VRLGLAIDGGVLFVLDSGPGPRLSLFDLDGRLLQGGFPLDGVQGPAPGACDLAVDQDRRVWLADPLAGVVRGCTLFGRETMQLGAPVEPDASELERRADRAGALGSPVAVHLEGSSDDLRVLVGSRGRRRHGLQLFDAEGALIRSLRPRGESHGRFSGVEDVQLDGRFALASEPREGRVQVYRDLDFHALVSLPARHGERLEPWAARRLVDGRFGVAFGGSRSGGGLLSRDGRFELELAGGAGTDRCADAPVRLGSRGRTAAGVDPRRTRAGRARSRCARRPRPRRFLSRLYVQSAATEISGRFVSFPRPSLCAAHGTGERPGR